ncbi:MAG TPA: DNA-formamidopyrimidine glycosylase family protein [Herpetosiphonaceae bacterium]
MAEGHAVARWAKALRVLIGEQLTTIEATQRWQSQAQQLVGAHLTAVDTHGKHLLLRSSGAFTIHCHAMQYGSWQIGEPGQELRKEARYVRLRLRTAQHEAVFFHGPVVEFLTDDELATHDKLNALGPDILHQPFDRAEVLRRLRAEPDRPIGDAILDQRIISGIGNIYKSEGLFLAGIDPRHTVAEVSDEAVNRIWDELIPLMQEGTLHYGPTTTLPESLRTQSDRGWVYRRQGRSCFRCGERITFTRQGDLKRATYYCPQCQR